MEPSSRTVRQYTLAWASITLLAIAHLALVPESTHASHYNDSGVSYGQPYGTGNTGLYVRDAIGGTQIQSWSGPHGGYTLTTGKCADCHAVHRGAPDGILLMRGGGRHAVCDYCHGGGGGSKTNIQMDNDYDADGVIATTTRGYGTGHTLGYPGRAPVDVRPAYADIRGLACFDCHTPHGNSERVLTTFYNPGRAVQPSDEVLTPFGPGGSDLTAAYVAAYGDPPSGLFDLDADYDLSIGTAWGVTTTEGNLVVNYAGDGVGAKRLPVWPTGRFLMVKNPHVEIVAASEVLDTVVASSADMGTNKLKIDWGNPLGPVGSGYSGLQDEATGPNRPWNPAGVHGNLTVSEFCTDCHDGAAGASTQVAMVWYPDEGSNDATGTYTQVYSHDAQARICESQMFMSAGGSVGNPGDPSSGEDDNYGPSCRKCHTGASSCGQCHGLTPTGAAQDAFGLTPLLEGETQFVPNAFAHTVAVSGLSGQCIDGGFSWPHRTLGVNMLKDEMYGIDYDGTPVAAGEGRDSGLTLNLGNWAWAWAASVPSENTTTSAQGHGSWLEEGVQLSTTSVTPAENLDSLCLDCHGDAGYWRGDDPSTYLDPARGWELLLKGLP